MSRRIEAVNTCERCGNSYGRPRFPSGRLEQMSQFRDRRFCSHACSVATTGAERSSSFWDCVDRSGGADACWPWMRAINSNGYGSFWARGKSLTASRHAYELTKGEIQAGPGYHGFVVMHSCDNRRCCNPDHLSLGTQKKNSDDRDAKGRGWWQAAIARATA